MLGIGKEYVNWRRLCRPPFSYRQKNVSLSIRTPKTINFPFVPNGKLMVLDVPIF